MVVAPKTNSGITAVIDNYLKGGLEKYKDIVFFPSTLECYGFKKITVFLSQLMKAVVFIIRFHPNIMHIHVSSHGSFYRKSIYILLSRILGKKVIIHIHPTHFIDFIDKASVLKRYYIKINLKIAHLIITLTQQVKEQLRKRFVLNCGIKVLKNPIFLSDYEYFGFQGRDRNMLLYLGWIIPKKGVFDLVRAAPLIKEKIDDFRLVICGNKETDKLKRMVEENGFSDYVEVRDWVRSKTKKALLAETAALILPSYTEGIPNVILEAMASGAPLLCTPVGGVSSLLKDKENCLFFEPGDIEDMAEKSVRLLKDIKIQEEIRQNNKELVKEFRAESISRNQLRIYERI